MDDPNTFYYVHGLKKKTYAVKANPDILKYKLPKRERGKTADELLKKALQKVFQNENCIVYNIFNTHLNIMILSAGE